MVTGLRGLVRHRVSGALVGQATNALSGFVLQVAAARELGASGLATFSLGYGALVLGTAVSSGLVGSALTVLDRHEPRIRAALHVWTVLVSATVGALGVLAAGWTGILPGWAVPLLGLACAAYLVEDTLRRLLMATGRFWSLPAVDLTGVVLALAVLAVVGASGRITMATFVLALLVSQAGAAIVAWWCLPAGERPRGPWRRPALGRVASFGVWSALTQTIRPAALTLLRTMLIALVGAAAYGPVEVARVYTAPTLLMVTGVGSFLLPHFVSLRPRGLVTGLRAADRAVFLLGAGTALMGLAGLLALPWLGHLVTGGRYAVPVGSVVAWTLYSVASATLLPYGFLAVVHGRQARVLAMRCSELVSLAAAGILAACLRESVPWTPLALALGPAIAAVILRQAVLVPLVRRDSTAPSFSGEPLRA